MYIFRESYNTSNYTFRIAECIKNIEQQYSLTSFLYRGRSPGNSKQTSRKASVASLGEHLSSLMSMSTQVNVSKGVADPINKKKNLRCPKPFIKNPLYTEPFS